MGQVNLFEEESPTPGLSPLLSWIGGKRKLAAQICSYFPPVVTGTYYEAFVGGAAVLCHLHTEHRIQGKVVLVDFNYDLINLYQTVKQSLPSHLAAMDRLATRYNKGPKQAEDLFHQIREEWNTGIRTADRFMFLKKTAFNKLWRVNRKGIFNVGWGKYPSISVDRDVHLQWSTFLRDHDAALVAGDTTTWPVPQPKTGDVVYLDPPYVETFGAYTEEGFTIEQQVKLIRMAREWDQRGVTVGVSNSSASKPLFEEHWPEALLVSFGVNYSVNCDGKGRANQQELFAVSNRRYV